MREYNEEKMIKQNRRILEERKQELLDHLEFYVDPAWKLPHDFERKNLARLDMSDKDMLLAMTMEYGEEYIMKKYKDCECELINVMEDGHRHMGVAYVDKRHHKLEPEVELTPTLFMFVATHLCRKNAVEEVYGGGVLRRFAEDYYQTQTTDVYKKIVNKKYWDKVVEDARLWVIENFDPLQLERFMGGEE